MSDETPPPPLRLKPRLRVEPESGDSPLPSPAPKPPAPADPANQTADTKSSKLRLKPRLDLADTSPPVSSDAAPLSAPPPVIPVLRVEPTTSPDEASGSSEETGLSSLSPDPAQTIPPTMPPAAPLKTPAVPAAKPLPQISVLAPSGAEAPKPPLRLTVPHVRAPQNMGDRVDLPPPAPLVAKKQKRRAHLALTVLLLLVALAAVVAYWTFLRPAASLPADVPTKKAVAKPSIPSSAKAATPPGLAPVPSPGAPEKKPILISRAEEQARLAEVASRTTTALAVSATPAAPTAPVPTVTTQLAPGVMATTTTTPVAGAASPAFRSWVAAAKINGVFQGTPARALINARLVRAGDTVDSGLGIVFDRVDAETKTIVFRDRAGATVSRSY